MCLYFMVFPTAFSGDYAIILRQHARLLCSRSRYQICFHFASQKKKKIKKKKSKKKTKKKTCMFRIEVPQIYSHPKRPARRFSSKKERMLSLLRFHACN